MLLGFSTGSLAKGDFQTALAMLEGHEVSTVELSALREEELLGLLKALSSLKLEKYRHISLHAPSALHDISELELVELLLPLELPVVLHPDVIQDWECWKSLGSLLLIENMDKRKPVGRTSRELETIFQRLPDARLCLDVGHSKQIDPSLHESKKILREHGDRLAEIHLSEVNSASRHERLNRTAIEEFQQLARYIPPGIPIILETPVSANEIEQELARAREVFAVRELALS